MFVRPHLYVLLSTPLIPPEKSSNVLEHISFWEAILLKKQGNFGPSQNGADHPSPPLTELWNISEIMIYLAMFSTTIDKILYFMGPHNMKMSNYFSVLDTI